MPAHPTTPGARPATTGGPVDPATAPAYLTEDPVDAYTHFLAEAQAIPAAKVSVLNNDPDIILHNIDNSLAAFGPLRAAVVSAVPSAPVNRFLELHALGLALLYAADRVIAPASTGAIAQRLAEVASLRTPMLRQLEVFASATVGLADPLRVQTLRSGTGKLDKAHDAVNIPAYFAELGAPIAGKHPFTAAQFAQLAEGGQWLLQQLVPGGAIDVPAAPDPAALIRNQFLTVVSGRYEAMRAVVAVVVGLADLDQHMPPLNTRVVSRKKAPPAVPPAAPPAVPPAAAPVTPSR